MEQLQIITAGNVVPIILMEEDLVHTPENPFCHFDPSCGCHEDTVLVSEVQAMVHDGLLTPDEATRFVMGRQV